MHYTHEEEEARRAEIDASKKTRTWRGDGDTPSERVKFYEGHSHAALRPDGLRAIAERIANENSPFTIAVIADCLRLAADKIEVLEESLKEKTDAP